MGRIVVGVDGSQHSIEALRWALNEARARHATVEAIITWSYPVSADPFGGVAWSGVDSASFEQGAYQALENAIAAASADPDERAAIVRRVLQGSPAHALVEASRDAELLVVGSRGHGGFAGMLLGSVSTQCVHHAHCPVTVIRPDGAH